MSHSPFAVPGLSGVLLQPGDPGWDDARLPWKRHVDQRPAALVVPRSVEDVARTVRAAASHGLRVTAQSTGHNAGPLGDLSRTVMIRTSGLDEVHIDAGGSIARAGAGVRWRQVIVPAAELGLAALSGTSGGVGVVGYTLGGGIGWFTRSHGLAAHSLTAVDLVTSDGQLRRVDADSDPELFWALRGGGGSFGVVTALEFRLHPIDSVVAGTLFWPIDRALDVLEAWRGWTVTIPHSVASVGRILRLPEHGDFPAHLAGRSFAMVEAVIQGSDEEADQRLAALRSLGPEMDTFRRMSVPELAGLHMDPQTPMRAPGDGRLVCSVTVEALANFVSAALEQRNTMVRSIEIRVLGGAARPQRADVGAVPGYAGEMALFCVGFGGTPAAVAQVEAALERLLGTMEPDRAPVEYINFVERSIPPEQLFGPALPRLSAVKRRIDPDDVIHANHPVPVGLAD